MNKAREAALNASVAMFSVPTLMAQVGTANVLSVAEAFYQFIMLKDEPKPATVIKPKEKEVTE